MRRSGRHLLSPEAWKTRLILWSGAIIVGLAASLFALGTEVALDLFSRLIEAYPYAPLLTLPLGLAGITWLTQRFAPAAAGSGIPQAIAGLDLPGHELRQQLLSVKVAVSKIALTLVGLLCGASIGREGPTVHIGSALLFSLGRIIRFPYDYMDRALILAGGAAGIGAAFNTPLAGIIFAIEEMGRSYESRSSGTLLTAVFLAGITAIAVQGNYTYFGSTSASLGFDEILVPILVCGILGGLAGGLFATLLVRGGRWLAPLMARRAAWVAGGCGLVVALIGLASGNLTFGTGYEEASGVITGEAALPGSYAVLKMLATLFSYLSGIPGGIFAPSLAAGAGLGQGLAHWLGDYPTTAIVILGMAAYFTGVVQTPITAFVIVMEMTDNHGLLLPLMATALVAYASSHLVCPEPIYQTMAESFMPKKVKAREDAEQPPD